MPARVVWEYWEYWECGGFTRKQFCFYMCVVRLFIVLYDICMFWMMN